jgi:hypothetical protein
VAGRFLKGLEYEGYFSYEPSQFAALHR